METHGVRKHMNFFSIMNRFFYFIFALCLLTVSDCSVVRAEDGYLEIGRDERQIYYLYLPSVEKREDYGVDYLVGWVKTVIRNPEPPIDGKIPHYTMELWAANKNIKQLQLLQGILYDKEDTIILSEKFQFARLMWEDCVPNSMPEKLWHLIIDTYKNKDK